jgi:glycosyltransferase involved in cell wall biosynthesis
MDGLEWKRGKWGRAGQSYYRWAEGVGVRWADALIADAPGIADYYRDEFAVPTELIRYGAKILESAPTDKVAELGFEPGRFHLVVARFEPENHVLEIVEGYHRSAAALPLVVVGSAPYAAEYTRRVEEIAAQDDRIHLVGGVWDQDLLDALYFHALTYVHGHSVGGTNPSLLRAIGAGTSVIAYEVGFNREIVGEDGRYFADPAQVAVAVEAAERDVAVTEGHGPALREMARARFDWDQVATEYLALAERLRGGESMHRAGRRARRSGRRP